MNDFIGSQLPCGMGIILSFVTEILRFIHFLKCTHLDKRKRQDCKSGYLAVESMFFFMITFTPGNSASLKEILGLERAKTRLCLVGIIDRILKLFNEHA